MVKYFWVMWLEVLAYLTDKNVIYKVSGKSYRLKSGEVLIHISNQTDYELLGNYEINDSVITKTNRFLSHYVGFRGYKNKEISQDFSVYVSEKGLLYTFYTPSFQGRGFRCAVRLRYELNKHWLFITKFGETIYLNRNEIGSGNDLIYGNKKADIQMQLRIKF